MSKKKKGKKGRKEAFDPEKDTGILRPVVKAGMVVVAADNTAGAAGVVTVRVQRGTFVWNNDGTIKNTDLLKTCYIAGADTVTITSTGASAAGTIIAVDPDGVTVEMK